MSPNWSIAPTEKTESYSASGISTVLQLGPSLPVETTQRYRSAQISAAVFNAFGSQPSSAGHPQELFKTARPGLGHRLQTVTATWKRRQHELHTIKIQSRVGKVTIKLTQPIHCASGATPIPLLPRIVSHCVCAVTFSSFGEVVPSHGSNQL